jgi:hypothetical protein
VQMRRPCLWLPANAQRSAVVRTAKLDPERTFRHFSDAKRGQRFDEELFACCVVADTEDDVIT